MLKQLLAIAAIMPLAASAQTVSTFEGLLPAGQSDTFYVNYAAPRTDVGFNSGLAHFPLFTDTSTFGGVLYQYIDRGFVYSNRQDTTSSGVANQFRAKPDSGYLSRAYAVAYGQNTTIKLLGAAAGKTVTGFYVTNSRYAYNSIKNGDAFARKFGDTIVGTHFGLAQGSNPDYYKMTIHGYSGGVLKPDTVVFYLADYRFNNSANDYIVKDWQFVNLLSLGHVDSLRMTLASSDTSQFGINTPLYYCIDNFITNESGLSIAPVSRLAAKVFPNPVSDELHIELQNSDDVASVMVYDAGGRLVRNIIPASAAFSIRLDGLSTGAYFINIRSKNGRTAIQRFIKQ